MVDLQAQRLKMWLSLSAETNSSNWANENGKREIVTSIKNIPQQIAQARKSEIT